MKQAVVTIKYEEEKLNAIKQYMGKKDADFEVELNDVLGVFEQKLVGNVGIRIKVVSQKDNMGRWKVSYDFFPGRTSVNVSNCNDLVHSFVRFFRIEKVRNQRASRQTGPYS